MRPPVPLVIARFQKWGLKGRLLLLLLLGQLMTVGALVVRGKTRVTIGGFSSKIILW
jgi:hypothetical protein